MAQKRRRLAQRRRACGYSQERFAEAVKVDRTTVTRWESGTAEPQPWHRRRIAEVLEVSVEELDNLLAEGADARVCGPPGEVSEGSAVVPALPVATVSQPDEPIADIEPDPYVLTQLITATPMPRQLVDHSEQVASMFVARYPSTPAQLMWPSVRTHLSRAGRAAASCRALRDRRRLTQVFGVLAGIAGNLALDLGRPVLGDEYLNLSKLAADEAEDADLAAWAAGLHSINLFVTGHFRAAADLLDHAHGIARPASSARRKSWLAALRARAYAACRVERTARGSLDDAYNVMRQATAVGRTDFFDQPRLDGIAGTTYLLLRDPANATAMLTHALRQRPVDDAKGRALLTLDQAACHVLQDEQQQALATIGKALDLARGQYVQPIVVRAYEVRQKVTGCDGTPAARVLDQRLMEISDGRSHAE